MVVKLFIIKKFSKLYCVGGYNESSIEYLSFDRKNHDENDDNPWLWYLLKHSMNEIRYNCSITFINDENILFVVGGMNQNHSILNSCEMYNLNNDKNNNNEGFIYTPNINYSRSHCGICSDEIENKVYVGGGHSDENDNDILKKVHCNVEYYDIQKMEWYEITNSTCYEYCQRPLLWKQHTNNNILYIMGNHDCNLHSRSYSTIGNTNNGNLDNALFGHCECIDLRDNRLKWNVVDNKNIHSLFHLNDKNYNNWRKRRLLYSST